MRLEERGQVVKSADVELQGGGLDKGYILYGKRTINSTPGISYIMCITAHEKKVRATYGGQTQPRHNLQFTLKKRVRVFSSRDSNSGFLGRRNRS